MESNEKKRVSQEEASGAAGKHRAGRRPWVPPALERLDLREAMAGGFTLVSDGATSS